MGLSLIAFVAGIVLLQCQASLPAHPLLLLCAGILALAACRLVPTGNGRMALRTIVLPPLCLLLGFAWAGWQAELRLADRLDAALEGRDLRLTGVVAALPQPFERGVRFEFRVDAAVPVDTLPQEIGDEAEHDVVASAPASSGQSGDVNARPLPGARRSARAGVPERLQLAWYRGRDAAVPDLVPGQRWRLTVRLKRPHGGANPHGFDYEAWLFERGLRATGYVRRGDGMLLDGNADGRAAWVEALRYRLRASLQARLPASEYPYAGILVALAVGDQGAVDSSLWNVFNRTGTTHLMSISGLHVTLVGALCGWLLGHLWRRSPRLLRYMPAQRAAIVAAWLGAAAYALLAGFGVPAQRTLYMVSVAALALLLARRVAVGRVLGIALLVVVTADPWAVLAPGFWLSFGAVAALLLIGAGQGSPLGWRQRLHHWGGAQWAVTLATLPVLLLMFHQFPLVGPLANLLAIPLLSFVVTPLALAGAVLPWTWPLQLAHALLTPLMDWLVWLADWPPWQVAAAPWPWIVAAALGALLLLLPRALRGRLPLACVLLLPALGWQPERPPAGAFWTSVLDVGQGQAILIRTAGHALLYDAGPRYGPDSDAGQRVVLPYLTAIGVARLDLLLVSHRDQDHAGGLASIRAELAPLPTFGSFPGSVDRPCVAGQAWRWDGVDFLVLHPARAASEGGNSNAQSCVLLVRADGASLLLTGDLPLAEEAVLVQQYGAKLAAAVLVVPHHGSRTASGDGMLGAVAPQVAIASVGYRNRFGHPHAEVLARYEAAGIGLWRTDRDGEVELHWQNGRPQIQGWRRQRQRYWQDVDG
jgi:competence protein ComEC